MVNNQDILLPTKYGKRNPDNHKNHHWDLFDISSYRIEKPTIICFSGNTCITDELANGFCKYAEKFLELMFKGRSGNDNPYDYVDIMGCVYGNSKRLINKELWNKNKKIQELHPDGIVTTKEGYLHEDEIDEFVQSILLPQCVDKNGKLLSKDECCKNLSKITFFTWCHGASEVNKISNKFYEKLSVMRVSNEDVVALFNSMRQISYAKFDKFIMFIPTINFVSLQDDLIVSSDVDRADYYEEKLKKSKDGIYLNDSDAELFNKSSEIYHAQVLNVVSNKLTNGIDSYYNEHSIEAINRDENWDSYIMFNGERLYPGANADVMSQMFSWSLCRSVENSIQNQNSDKYIPKVSLEDLKIELDSIKNAYAKEQLGERN